VLGANAQELARRDHDVEHYAWDLHYNHLARALVDGSAYTITDNGTLAAEPNHVSIDPKPPVSSVHQRAGNWPGHVDGRTRKQAARERDRVVVQ
jgi:hypothetical protein